MADPRLSDVAPTIDMCDSTFSLSERIANAVLRNNIAATVTRSSLPAGIHGANHPRSDVPSDPPKPLAMPTGQPRWLHHGQRVPPVNAAGEPVQGDSGGVGGLSRLNGALLIQCQLFMQNEILCCEGRAWVQAEEEKAHASRKSVSHIHTTCARLCISRWSLVIARALPCGRGAIPDDCRC